MSNRHISYTQTVQQMNGTPYYLGTITCSATAKNNATTAVPFAIPEGSQIMLQGDVVYSFDASGATAVLTTATSVAATPTVFYLLMSTGLTSISCIAGGAANIKVFQLK